MSDIAIQCQCGTLKGTLTQVDSKNSNRIICYCQDCQSYAQYLSCENKVLDQYGGTEIVQVSPSRIQLKQGSEELECLKLTKNGMVRWYTRCCKTPVANTIASSQMAFAGIPHIMLDPNGLKQLEPPLMINASSNPQSCPDGAHNSAPLSFLLKFIGQLIFRRLRGEHQPSPFFDSTGKIKAEPKVLKNN